VDTKLIREDFAGNCHLCFVFKLLTAGFEFVLMKISLSDNHAGLSGNDIVSIHQRHPTAVLPNMALTAVTSKFSKLCKWSNNMLAIWKCGTQKGSCAEQGNTQFDDLIQSERTYGDKKRCV